MSPAPIHQQEDKKTNDHAGHKRIDGQTKIKATFVTAIDYVIGVCFALSLTAAFAEYQLGKPRAAIWWGFVCWISAGAGLTALGLDRFKTQPVSDAMLTTRIVERARLNVFGIRMVTLQPGKPLTVNVILKNQGKTAAVEMRHIGRLHTSYVPLNVAAFIASWHGLPPKPGPVIPPDAPNELPFVSDRPLSYEEVDAVRLGQLHVYVIGDLSYEDVFGVGHLTEFCGEYVPETNKFAACLEHNRVT